MKVPSNFSHLVIVGSAVITGVVVYYATGSTAIGMLAMITLIFAPDISSFVKSIKEGYRRGHNRRNR